MIEREARRGEERVGRGACCVIETASVSRSGIFRVWSGSVCVLTSSIVIVLFILGGIVFEPVLSLYLAWAADKCVQGPTGRGGPAARAAGRSAFDSLRWRDEPRRGAPDNAAGLPLCETAEEFTLCCGYAHVRWWVGEWAVVASAPSYSTIRFAWRDIRCRRARRVGPFRGAHRPQADAVSLQSIHSQHQSINTLPCAGRRVVALLGRDGHAGLPAATGGIGGAYPRHLRRGPGQPRRPPPHRRGHGRAVCQPPPSLGCGGRGHDPLA